MFYDNYFWLILATSVESGKCMFEDINIDINCNIHIAVPTRKMLFERHIYDLYNPSRDHGGHVKIKKIGEFSEEMGYKMKLQNGKYWRRRNMTGLTFRSAIVIPPDSMDLKNVESEQQREINSMHRFQSATIQHCRDFYNFSLDMQITESWGYLQKNGKFDGLVRLLQERLIDFGGSPLLFKYDRLPVVDYSFGNWILRSTFIFRKPKQESSSFAIFLQPFDTYIWTLILIFIMVVLVALKLSFDVKPTTYAEKQQIDSSWTMMFLFIAGAFCQQGATCFPLSLSSRVLFVCVFFFCILIYQFYSASIVSYILLDPSSTITSLKDLLESSLEVGIEDILIDRNYFVQTKDLLAVEIFKKKVKKFKLDNDSGFYKPSIGLRLVQRGGFSFHVETSTAYPLIEQTFTNQEICELEELQMYRTQPMYTNLPKHSPFKEMMNYCMLNLVEKGVMFHLRRFWDARKPGCLASDKKVNTSVSLKEISCGLLVLVAGLLVTLVVLFIELAIINLSKSSDKFGNLIHR